MKSGLIQPWTVGLFLGLWPLAGICQPETSSPPVVQSTGVATSGGSAEAGAQPATPVAPAAVEKPVPAAVPAAGPLAEMVKLANSGVDQSVLLAYVTNSTSTFNLTAEQIIYLNDIGVPAPVVTAMLEHDQQLKAAAASSVAAAAAPAPEPAPATPAPVEPVPAQPDDSGPAPEPVEAPLTPPEPVSTGTFDDALSPYGAWVYIPGYGRCWQPTVMVLNPGWQPYFDGGHWVYTDCGWYWLSDYSWGWAPFHYGRWFRHGQFGWCWAPDTVWGPSWVSWRYTGDYCGWAPLPPGCYFSFGVGLTFHGRHVRDFDDCGLERHHYRFVAWRDFDRHHLHERALGREHADRIFDHTVVVNRFEQRNNRVMNEGIAVQRVAAATHAPVQRMAIREVSSTRQVSGRAERLDPTRRTLTIARPVPPATRTGPALVERSPLQARPVRLPEATSPRQSPGQGAVRPGQSPTTHPTPGISITRMQSGSHEWTPVQTGVPESSLTTRSQPQRPEVPNRTTINPQPTPTPNRGPVLSWRGPNNPSQNPTPWVTPSSPARPAWNQPQSPQQTVTRSYQAPPARPAPAQVPQYNYTAPQRSYSLPPQRPYTPPQTYIPPQRAYTPPPSYTPPARNYSPPPAPAPSRPSVSEAPRYSPPPAAPSRPSGGGSPPASSGPPSRGGGNSRR